MIRFDLDFLTIISARLNISNVVMKINLTLDEIREKSPGRMDYIKPMEKSIKDLCESYEVFTQLEAEWRASRQRNLDLENIILNQKVEIDKMKKEIELINKNLEI
jgi:hypothetical protein